MPKEIGFISLFHPRILNKRSNFIILSLFNGEVIYISPLYEFLSRKGNFPSLGRFSNNQSCLLSLSFRNVKYYSTQYIVPRSKVWRIPALCYDLKFGMIFISTKIFQEREWFWALPHTHPQPLPCLKKPNFNKQSSLDFGS